MKWAARLAISILNFSLMRVTWLTLQGVRACNPELRQPSVVTLSNGAYTIVFWPARRATPWYRQVRAHTNTVWLSTWLLRQWKHWPTWARRGRVGAAAGTDPMPSTSNFPERHNGHGSKD